MRLRRPFWNLSTDERPRRIKLVVAYDGYDFCGFAPQYGQRTVYSTLTDGIRQVSGEVSEITGASRTDSGAHARGQVVHFDTTNPMPVDRWPRVVNQFLPDDLSVVSAHAVGPGFHSRFSARDRFYRYRILTGARDPFRKRFAFYYGKPLDAGSMHAAAQTLVGEHNFLAFSQLLEEGRNAVRTLYSVQVRPVRDEVWIDVVGTAFVRGMMRRISGALWEIGRGKSGVERLEHLLAQRVKDEIEWPPVLPANGLTLMKVRYGRRGFDSRTHDQDEFLTEQTGQTE